MLEQSQKTPKKEGIVILLKKLYLRAFLSRFLSLFIGEENGTSTYRKVRITLHQLFRSNLIIRSKLML